MKRALPVWVFPLCGVLFLMLALEPLLRGRPMNVAFFGAGVVWLLIGVAVAKKGRKGSDAKHERL